jgi:hypothetical protein
MRRRARRGDSARTPRQRSDLGWAIAPDGLLRRVDTFSRLAESSAAPAPTPAALFDARGPSSGAHLEKCQSRQSRRLAPSRDAADTLARRTGSPLPVHRRDGLGRDQHACLGCPLRSSKRGHRVRVVFREANAGVVGKTRKRQKNGHWSHLSRVLSFSRRVRVPVRGVIVTLRACETPRDAVAGPYRAWVSSADVVRARRNLHISVHHKQKRARARRARCDAAAARPPSRRHLLIHRLAPRSS